jgi:hypothetical protein
MIKIWRVETIIKGTYKITLFTSFFAALQYAKARALLGIARIV